MTTPSPATAPRDDEPLDSDHLSRAWANARGHEERDEVLYQLHRELLRRAIRQEAETARLAVLVGNSSKAAAEFADEQREMLHRLTDHVALLAEEQKATNRAVGQLAENQGIIARELADRARQDSLHETEITAQRAAIAETKADVRAVRLKATAIKAGIGAGTIAIWEAVKHLLLPLL